MAHESILALGFDGPHGLTGRMQSENTLWDVVCVVRSLLFLQLPLIPVLHQTKWNITLLLSPMHDSCCSELVWNR